MTTANPRRDNTRRRPLTARARANLATIVVEGDEKSGRATPKWIRELAESRDKAS